MEVYTFLKSLPAILGFVGFFLYLWAGQSRVGGDVFKEIVRKLRADPNINVHQYSSLTPAKIGKILASDSNVRNAVNEADRKLLQLLIVLQHILTVIVLLVCSCLVIITVWLYLRPAPLAILSPGLGSIRSDGVIVDLDPIRVEWTATGKDEMLSISLENVDSHAKTQKKIISSNVKSVQFEPEEVQSVATTRSYRGHNRVRSLFEWDGNVVTTPTKDLQVGIEVELRFFGRLIAPGAEERPIHTLLASIDNSTQMLPSDYEFSGDFVGWYTNRQAFVIPLRSTNSDGEVVIPGIEKIDWTKNLGFVYGGPDDPSIVRCAVFGLHPGHASTTNSRN